MNNIQSALAQRRREIADRWLSAIAKTYPSEASPFLREPDRFRNPVAHVLRENVVALVDALVLGEDWDRATEAMTAIAQVRTVQGFSADEARAFVDPLKMIVRELLPRQADVLARLDARFDRLTTMAADLHRVCRGRIDAIAAREAQRRTWLLDRLRARVTS